MRSLTALAAEILSNDQIVTWRAVRATCRLLEAYADYNEAAADKKIRRVDRAARPASTTHPRAAIESMMATLAELGALHERCELEPAGTLP